MKVTYSVLTGALLGLFASPVQAKLNVVATTADLAAIAREIGGELVNIETLARPTQDPHFVSPKPSFIVKLNRADALVEGGTELEQGWLPSLVDKARNSKLLPGGSGRISCNRGIQMLGVPSSLDRSKGDIHAGGNPHYSIDPLNAMIVAEHICAKLCELESESCAVFQANLKSFLDRVDAKHVEWQRILKPYHGRRVVSYHDSWPYFARRFGIRVDLFLEPKPGLPPSPSHLAKVVAQINSEKIGVIIVDPYLNRRTAETVARYTGVKIVDVTQFPGGVKGTEGGYIQLQDYLVRSLAEAFGGE